MNKRGNPLIFSDAGDVKKLFFIFFLAFLSFSTTKAQVIVSLGDDIAVCLDEDVLLSDLNPVILNANGDKWWETSGDGVFNVNTFTYPNAISYTPGAGDILAGSFTIILKARETNPNGTVYEDQAKIFIRDDETFACNDNITVPLNFYCEYRVTPPMLLEGEEENIPYNLYDIDIYDVDGNIIPNDLITGDYIGQTLTYNITHECSWNACGGTINVQDNYHPITDCGNDTITCKYSSEPEYVGFPFDTSIFTIDTIIKDTVVDNKYVVEGWDACGDVTLTYTDNDFFYDCNVDSIFQQLIVRSWKAEDQSGNISNCIDSILIKRITIDSVKLPRDWNNMDTTALQCDGEWLTTALPNGNPSPDYTGWPEKWGCNIEYTYQDIEFPGCGNTFDVTRKWTIIDWCDPDNIVHHTQIIKIMDTLPPTLTCIEDTIIVSADPYDCASGVYALEIPTVTDNCNTSTLFVHVFNNTTNEEVSVLKYGSTYTVDNLPLGIYRATFTAIDDCNNIGRCSYYFKVIDDQRPYAVCDQHTKVNLGSNGEARLFPENLDDGSYDNCGIVDMKIRKMSYACDPAYFEFGDYIGFCCEESNTTIMVALQITDAAGNVNSCMVEVIVEDKLPPQIICPPDITVSCDFYFNPDNLDRYFGKVVKDEALREDIIINDYYNNGVVGQDGYAYDNCDVDVSQSNELNLNSCNVGKIFRTFTSEDNGGRTNSCIQTITIYNPNPFNYYGNDIIWPDNTSFTGCSNLEADTSVTGAPIVNDNMCSMVAMRYDDQMYSVQEDACEKIVRTWTIRDWCQDNELKWTHEQIIMLNNEEAPTFTSDCEDRDVCVYGECSGLVELSASATDDCTPEENLVWRWKLDRDNNGTFDEYGQGNHFSKTLNEGIYEIAWIVEDKCGNISTCTYKFTVKDCKKPTPYCIQNLTTAVMNYSGMVTVLAKDFDHNSYDNCTPSNYGECGCLTDLKFSFSSDVNDTLYNITCDSLINGVAKTFYLKMWVTDNAGNQDYCTVQLRVEDNNGVCPDTDGIEISGQMTKWKDNAPVGNVSLELMDSNNENINNSSTGNNGKFEFSNLTATESYTIEPKDKPSECINGISTLDIVMIQKHILGIENFNSPYQYIAADANNNKKITSSDILAIRKLILGITNSFPQNDCWVYADAKQALTTQTAFEYNSKLTYNNINASIDDADLKVIKIGDINGSYTTAGLPEGLDYRNGNIVGIEIENIDIFNGQEVKVPVYFVANKSIEGMQFTVDYNPINMVFEGFESGQIKLGNNNFGYNNLDKGMLTFSWNTMSGKDIDSEAAAFYLIFKSNTAGTILQNITINSKITDALSIVKDNETPVILKYRNTHDTDGFAVYQNTPNPFNEETSIRFNLPNSETVTLEIYDINGKLMYSKQNVFDKGMNQFKVLNTDFKVDGIYYYTIKIAENAITKKMILIK